MALDQPRLGVRDQPGLERRAKLIDRAERSHPEDLFLEDADEPLRHPVAFGRPDEGRAGRHPQEPAFRLNVVTHLLTPVIVADLQPRRASHCECPELPADAVADRFQGFDARGLRRGMAPDAFKRAVIDRHEDGDRAVLQRDGAGGIVAPHLIGLVGDDGAVVGLRPQDPLGPARGQEAGLSHQAEDPELGGANPLRAEARPDLAMPFAEKR